MYTNSFKSLTAVCLLSIQLLNFSTAYAKSGGSMDGGGGDASEERVNEIRSDILKWIKDEGARELELPNDLSYGVYVTKMIEILEPQKVIVGFVDQDDQYNDELKVTVSGAPKTCRGFISTQDLQPHILCNIARFKNTSAAEQYKLIHHEYAGLVRIEKNLGSASDYQISSQITEYLEKQTILKLAVKGKQNKTPYYSTDDQPGSTFGPVPFILLQNKTICDQPEEVESCRIFDESDVQKEIDLFSENMDQRKQTVLQKLEFLTRTAERVKDLAGNDTTLKSYKFYSDAAKFIAGLPKTDETIIDTLLILEQNKSPVIKGFVELKTLIVKYKELIAKESDESISHDLKVAKNKAVLKKFNELRADRLYGHIIWRFFTNEQNIIQATESGDDNRKFNLNPFVKIVSSCALEDLDLHNIAISTEAQKTMLETRGYFNNYLALIEDQPVIKKIIDASPVVTFKCEKVRKYFKEPEMKFDPKTNTFTNQYEVIGSNLFDTGFKSPAMPHLQSPLRQFLN